LPHRIPGKPHARAFIENAGEVQSIDPESEALPFAAQSPGFVA